MRRWARWAALGLLAAGAARAEELPRFIPVFDADIRGMFSRPNGGPNYGGLVGTALVLPAWRATDSGFLLPMYSFDGDGFDRVVAVLDPDQILDTENVFVYRQIHNLDLGWKQSFDGGWEGKIFADGAYALNKETPSEKLGKGLYDHYDLGGRAVLTLRDVQDGKKAPLSLALKVYERRYHNFQSLYSQHPDLLTGLPDATVQLLTTKNVHPKDYLGVELAGSAVRWLDGPVRLQGGYTAALRMFRDDWRVDGQGIPGDKKRVDLLNVLSAGGQMGDAKPWSYGLDAQVWFNLSDGNSYDPNQKGAQAYVDRYYQFWSPHVTPWVGYVFGGDPGLRPSVKLAMSTMAFLYPYRPALERTGNYRDVLERDYDYAASIDGQFPFAKWISATAGVTGFITRSNNRYEQFLQYSYELLTASAGVRVSF